MRVVSLDRAMSLKQLRWCLSSDRFHSSVRRRKAYGIQVWDLNERIEQNHTKLTYHSGSHASHVLALLTLSLSHSLTLSLSYSLTLLLSYSLTLLLSYSLTLLLSYSLTLLLSYSLTLLLSHKWPESLLRLTYVFKFFCYMPYLCRVEKCNYGNKN